MASSCSERNERERGAEAKKLGHDRARPPKLPRKEVADLHNCGVSQGVSRTKKRKTPASSHPSTYAWFANNNTVTASTAQISATAQNSLAIKDADEDWKTAITLTNGSAKTVSPIHYYVDAENKIKWYSISSSNAVVNPDDEAATVPFATYISDTTEYAGMFNTETESSYNVSNSTSKIDYVIGNSFKLKATGQLDTAGDKITSTITVQLPDDVTKAEEAANIYKAFHVVYVVTDPGASGGSATVSRIDTDFGSGDLTFDSTTKKASLTVSVGTDIVASVVAEREYDVVAYLYLEGEDDDCFTTNATSVQNLRVTFNFAKAAIS